MKLYSKKRSANKSGAVLVTAEAVLLIMSILMTATISYVSNNRKQTNANYCHKQAYLTASTTLQSFVSEIQKVTASPSNSDGAVDTAEAQQKNIAELKKLASNNGGQGTTVKVTYDKEEDPGYKVGKTRLNIAQDNGSTDNLVITAYTTYADVTEKVAAHIYIESKTKPAAFTNTIETIGKGDQVSWDNLNVIGDTAVLNENGNKVYALRNDAYPQGSFYIFGSVARASANAKFVLAPSLTERRGTFVQISGNYWGEIKAESSMKRADGYNYIYIGGTANFSRNSSIGTEATKTGEDRDVDLICSRFVFDKPNTSGFEKNIEEIDKDGSVSSALGDGANTYKQYGNVYVYKRGSNEYTNGDFIANGDSCEIFGDLNVEGDVYIKDGRKVVVHGNANIGGKIKTGSGFGGDIECKGTMKTNLGTIDRTARGAIPKMEQKSTDYIYMPEDLVANSNSTIGALKGSFDALHAKEDGKYKSKKLSECKQNVTVKDDAGNDVKFDYYVDQDIIWDTKASSSMNILINVPVSKNIVILMEDGLYNDQGVQVVVKNDSKMVKSDDGTMNHQFNCYFVSDMDKNGKLKITEKNAAGISQHEGSTACSYEFRKLRVYDFETFTNMFDPSYYGSSFAHGDIDNTKPKDTFVFNPSNNDKLEGVFTPSSSSIFFFLGEGTNFSATNNSCIQACIYGPEATFQMKTQGIGGFTCCDASGSTATTTKLGVMGIGVFIVQKFDSDNTGNYIYTRPSSTSALVNTKRNDALNMNGFVLDRYDHS